MSGLGKHHNLKKEKAKNLENASPGHLKSTEVLAHHNTSFLI